MHILIVLLMAMLRSYSEMITHNVVKVKTQDSASYRHSQLYVNRGALPHQTHNVVILMKE